MEWKLHNPRITPDHLGYIPSFLNLTDPRPAAEQFDTAYRHGGGWSPLPGWSFNPQTETICYPGDPPYKPYASTTLRDERIYIYPHAWVAIVQPDGSLAVSRMD